MTEKYIYVKLNQANYEYDVHSLVKAFYTQEQGKVVTPDSKHKPGEDIAPFIELCLGESNALLWINGKEYMWQSTFSQKEKPKEYKDGFKQFLYQTLVDVTGRVLPWGNLTGIRPTKLAFAMLEEGKSEQEIESFLC